MHKNDTLSHKALKIYLSCRFVIISFIGIFGSTLYLFHKWPYSQINFKYFLIWFAYALFLSIVFWLLWQKEKHRFLLHLALGLAPFTITILVYITGSANSFFPILYIFVIIASVFFFQRRGAFFMAAFCFILYGGLLDLEYFNIIPNLGEKPKEEIFFTLLINFFAFFAIAFLGDLLFRRLEKSEKKLQFLETLHRCILESIQTGVVTIDEKNRILYMNPAAEVITGYKEEKLKGKPITHLFQLHDELPKRSEFSFVRPNGKVISLGLSAYLLLVNEGKKKRHIGKVLVFQDLTYLRQIEKLSVLGELAAHLAHEIKTPLTSISGCMQMLQHEQNISSEMRPLIELALKEARKLDALISSFLSYARPGKKKERFNLTVLIKETVESFKLGINPDQIKINLDLPSETLIKGSKEELRRVFLNLLTNAQQAMPEGGQIAIKMKTKHNEVIIEIKDTGVGIPSEIQEHLFEPFFTTRPEGSGLGLAIVHKIITDHEGRIEVESEKNRGATFRIYLPLC